MKEVYIVMGIRTPIAKTNGGLKNILPEKLAAACICEIVKRSSLEKENISEIIMGNTVGTGGNIARLSSLLANMPFHVPALTVDSQCGSAMMAIDLAISRIKAGDAEIIIAGGAESTSLQPQKRYHKKDPRYAGEDKFYSRSQFSPEHIGDPSTLQAAEITAEKYNISREELDFFAYKSHQRACYANEKGTFKDIIFPVEGLSLDEGPRKIALSVIERGRSLVKKQGLITNTNTCLTNDGAAMVLLASGEAVRKYNLKPVAIVKATSSIGVNPNLTPLAAITAVEKLLNLENNEYNIDAYEINQPFSVIDALFMRRFEAEIEKLNILGGALAYGHPYAASGAIILLHLIKALQVANGRFGIAAIASAGGLGNAMLIERLGE